MSPFVGDRDPQTISDELVEVCDSAPESKACSELWKELHVAYVLQSLEVHVHEWTAAFRSARSELAMSQDVPDEARALFEPPESPVEKQLERLNSLGPLFGVAIRSEARISQLLENMAFSREAAMEQCGSEESQEELQRCLGDYDRDCHEELVKSMIEALEITEPEILAALGELSRRSLR